MKPQDATVPALERIKLLYRGRGYPQSYQQVIELAFDSKQDAAQYLTHGDPECRAIASFAISQKWHVDSHIVDKLIEAINTVADPTTTWELYTLLGTNIDRKAVGKVLLFLIDKFDCGLLGMSVKCAVYAAMIAQSQRLGLFHGSTLEFLEHYYASPDEATRAPNMSDTMFDMQFLGTVRSLAPMPRS